MGRNARKSGPRALSVGVLRSAARASGATHAPREAKARQALRRELARVIHEACARSQGSCAKPRLRALFEDPDEILDADAFLGTPEIVIGHGRHRRVQGPDEKVGAHDEDRAIRPLAT